MEIIKIAVLLTCHNRQEKTRRCLNGLKNAINTYNSESTSNVDVEVFLTDDGCTDKTVDYAREIFPDDHRLHILHGDGNLYWAGGMRFCWNEAMKRHEEWDFYLLLNDDVEPMPNLFSELFVTTRWSKDNFGKVGLCSGNTCSITDPTKRSFGGRIWVNKFFATSKALVPNGKPQMCDLTNANILLVPKQVVDKIGMFYEGYHHGHADYDYGIIARKKDVPVVVTANFCGKCENEHLDNNEQQKQAYKVIAMSLTERKQFFSHPLRSDADYLLYVRRTSPLRYPIVWLGRKLNLYFPKLYYKISGIR